MDLRLGVCVRLGGLLLGWFVGVGAVCCRSGGLSTDSGIAEPEVEGLRSQGELYHQQRKASQWQVCVHTCGSSLSFVLVVVNTLVGVMRFEVTGY
ncbi:hypothetical protein EX30DRAFT_192446 [Ascodesmis nigricans]|uniref:Uncharacterized protein n=1 Tax=Ascodesmis nigricans TaxID=341454 RepID=A0A4S2N0Q2_9PEZI|nr:hypothetical protein EX30DRAFT_192446 [Ascodesmis nigricans]